MEYPAPEDISNWTILLSSLLQQQSPSTEDIINHAITNCNHYSNSHTIFNIIFNIKSHQPHTQPHIQQLTQLFITRLSTPQSITSYDQTLTLYSTFLTNYHPPQQYEPLMLEINRIIHSYTSSTTSKSRETHETILSTDSSIQSFYNYIKYELSLPKPNIIQIKSLYLRCILLHPTSFTLWMDYIHFLTLHLPIKNILISAFERAILIIPSSHLFSLYMKILCMLDYPISDIHNLLLKALDLLKQDSEIPHSEYILLLSTFIDIHQKKKNSNSIEIQELRQAYNTCLYLLRKFSIIDESAFIFCSFAQFEANEAKDESAARSVYEKALKSHPLLPQVWIEYLNFEEKLPTCKAKCKSIYVRAFQKKNLDLSFICQSALNFEFKYGDLNSYSNMYSRINNVLTNNPTFGISTEPVSVQPELVPQEQLEKRMLENDAEVINITKKRKQDNLSEPVQYHIIEDSMAGNMIFIPLLNSRVDVQLLKENFKVFGKIVEVIIEPNPETGALESYIEFENADQVRNAYANGPKSIADSEIKIMRCRPKQEIWNFKTRQENTKIYVSNLSNSIEKSELREMFKSYGKIKEIRLIKRVTFSFAYIEYFDEESAARSLQMDQYMMGSPISKKIGVKISDPSKFNVKEVDEKEIYVSNLPMSISSEADLATIFQKFGKINNIRIVRDDDKKSKCSGFISFDDMACAKEALSMNGVQIEGRFIIVTISDPNMRGRKRFEKHEERERKFVNTTSFVPRTTRKPKLKMGVASIKEDAVMIDAQKKSQDDFRQLLMKH